MSNVFTPYFARVDDLLPKLADGELTEGETVELVDLFRRAVFYLANHINYMAAITPHLILDPEPETVPGEAVQDASGTAPE